MITDDLVLYIETQLQKNTPREIITSRLLQAGWNPLDIEEGFLAIAPIASVPSPKQNSESVNHTDPYRESPVIQKKPLIALKESPKVWVPTQVKPIVENLPVSEPKTNENTLTQNEISPIVGNTPSGQKFQSKVYVYVIPTEDETATSAARAIKEDLLPALAPKELETGKEHKEEITSNVSPKSNDLQKTPSSQASVAISQPSQTQKIISSNKDFASSVITTDSFTEKSKKSYSGVKILILLILLIGGSVFAFMNGSITLPSFQFSLIKKDPKELLLSASSILSRHDSYKMATEIKLSSPLFSNITSGLLTGEPVSSNDRDSLSFAILGTVNNSPDVRSHYSITTQSSFFDNPFTIENTSISNKLYFKIPDLTQFFPSDITTHGLVAVEQGELETFIHELPPFFGIKIEESDKGKILSKGFSNGMKADVKNAFEDFVDEISINEKNPEKIRDTETYHYNINVDRQTTKKLLTRLIQTSKIEFSANAKPLIDEALGSVSVNSFEMWVGKASGTLVQYRIILSAPLSKVLGLNDNGIAGNEVVLEWQTTFYDFDKDANTVTVPENAILLPQFIDSLRDFKIKNVLNSFSAHAQKLKKIEGRYGLKSNTSGSCASPTEGSLFSPIGHNSKTSIPVGSIAQSMNLLISSTSYPPVCHSTANTWMIAVPLASNPNIIFCADSTGASKELQAMPNGTVCK